MADYSIIADLGNEIVKLLRENLCPEPIKNPESIMLCPHSDSGDYMLGIHLYDIQEDGDYPQLNMITIDEKTRRFPPMPIILYYMFTVKSQAHISSKSIDEQRILGRVMQVLYDNPTFKISHARNASDVVDEEIYLTPNLLSFEDKSKLWNTSSSSGSKLALYFKAAPVLINSNRVAHASRVIDISVNVSEKE